MIYDPDSEDLTEMESHIWQKLINLTKSSVTLNEAVKTLSTNLDDYKKTQRDNTKEIKAINTRDGTTLNRILELEDKVQRLEFNDALNQTHIHMLQAKVEKLERVKRKQNLIIRGVDETFYPQPSVLVANLFNEIGLTYTTADCDAIYRIGVLKQNADPTKKKQCNPIMVQLALGKSKGLIYSNLKNLANTPVWKRIRISDDQIPSEAQEDSSSQHMPKLKNCAVELTRKNVKIYNITYTPTNLELLPAHLTLESAKTIQVNDGTAFQSKHSWFSNLYPCNIEWDQIIFRSSEHAFGYEAAKTCNAPNLAQKIRYA